MTSSLRKHRRPGAFTILELLTVIAIVLILLILAVPAVGSLMRSLHMNQAASMITDELNFARQTALARNRDVEMRFYRIGSKGDPNDRQYRSFRCYLIDGTNSAQPLGRVKSLPEPAIISADAKFSTLMDFGNAGRSGLWQSNEVLPGGVGQAGYVGFRFRANGGTSLKPVNPPEGNWFFTIYLENDPKKALGIPDNYFTAQVDPVTGRVRSYRP